MPPRFVMPEILLPAPASVHSDLSAIRLLSASDTAREIKLGIVRQLLLRNRLTRLSIDALAVAYRDEDVRLRSAILASICSAVDRWGIEASVLASEENDGLVRAIQNECEVVLWPWCLLARAALQDKRLVADLKSLKQKIQHDNLDSLQSALQSTAVSDPKDQAIKKAIVSAINRIENQQSLLAFCY